MAKKSVKQIREDMAKITTKDVPVYPHKLRDIINTAGKNGRDQASFVKFTPSASKVIVPTIIPEPETKSKKVKDDDPNKVKIKYIDVGIKGIFLPIKPTEDTVVGSWQSVEGMGFTGIEEYATWKGYKALSGILLTILPQEAVFAMKSGVFGGGIDNPHDRLAFAGHSRRSFQIAWEFMKPANAEEEETLNSIISIFRMTSLGNYGKYVIAPPPAWQISFHSFPNYKTYLAYRRCGFASVNVKFGGEGDFHAMESGMPFMSLSLDVNELDYPVRDDMWIKPIKQRVELETEDLSEADREKLKANNEFINKATGKTE